MGVKRVAITGGPCSGKSELLKRIKEYLHDNGVWGTVLPELYTELAQNNLTPELLGFEKFQKHLIGFQIQRESFYHEALMEADGNWAEKYNQDLVVVCDRGVPDSAAYMPDEQYRHYIAKQSYGREAMLHRYDLVIHLVTAAQGAEEFYSNKTNSHRKESATEARALDQATLLAWQGHPHHFVIGNETDFETKMQRAMATFARGIHMSNQQPTEIEHKFLVLGFDQECIPAQARQYLITQTYLRGDGSARRVRSSRATGTGEVVYTYTEKQDTANPLVRIEKEKEINKSAYDALLSIERHPVCDTVTKQRSVWFGSTGQKYELDVFGSPWKGLVFLELEVSSVDAPVVLPEALQGLRLVDVTADSRFTNWNISKTRNIRDLLDEFVDNTSS
jgi:CYTH domain-containing protein/thymidylate kinase